LINPVKLFTPWDKFPNTCWSVKTCLNIENIWDITPTAGESYKGGMMSMHQNKNGWDQSQDCYETIIKFVKSCLNC
jgi:hypothetical protein